MFQETPVIQDKPSPNSQTEMDADENGREKIIEDKKCYSERSESLNLNPLLHQNFLVIRSIGLDLMLHRSLCLKIIFRKLNMLQNRQTL